MTREEYLLQLKSHLTPLTMEEQSEALQYYSDYFEECNDDQKVINELGSPEELAKTIVENFANVLVAKESEKKDRSGSGNQNPEGYSESLYYEFQASSVRNMNLNFMAADVVLISGDKFCIETRGITREYMDCSLDSEGTLKVKNNNIFNYGFFSHAFSRHIVPKILVMVPENCSLNVLKINMGAGNFRTRDVNIRCSSGTIEVGAGNLEVKSVYGGNLNYHCGMGNITFQGSVTGTAEIDCGMGNISLNLKGRQEDFSYDAKVGLGDFRINGEKKSGIGQSSSTEKKSNHFAVNCGMGSVTIKIEN